MACRLCLTALIFSCLATTTVTANALNADRADAQPIIVYSDVDVDFGSAVYEDIAEGQHYDMMTEVVDVSTLTNVGPPPQSDILAAAVAAEATLSPFTTRPPEAFVMKKDGILIGKLTAFLKAYFAEVRRGHLHHYGKQDRGAPWAVNIVLPRGWADGLWSPTDTTTVVDCED